MATVEFQNVDKLFPGGVHALTNLNLTANDGEFLVLVGPSGCGKSTALRLVAGLEDVTSGNIMIGGDRVNSLPPQSRDIAMVFQNYALYPHKTVGKNLEFPLRMMKAPKDQRRERLMKAARLLGLEDKLDVKPKALSGGQRQRVAMGRAIVRDPAVFLMDEPLSNLDAKLRVEIRAEIAELQRRIGITTIYVTHDQVEAMTLGDRVAVLCDGVLQQVAPSHELYQQPANTFVASFIGSPRMNIFETTLRAGEGGAYFVKFGDLELPLPVERLRQLQSLERLDGDRVLAGLRPESFVKPDSVPAGCRFRAILRTEEELGHEQIIYFKGPVDVVSEADNGKSEKNSETTTENTMVGRFPADYEVKPGDQIDIGVETSGLYLFNADGEAV